MISKLSTMMMSRRTIQISAAAYTDGDRDGRYIRDTICIGGSRFNSR